MANNKPICSVDGCINTSRTRGYCDAHYKRLLKYGSPTGQPQKPHARGEPCTMSGCDRPISFVGKGWCSMHYQRWQRYGDPLAVKAVRTLPGQACKADNCERPVSSKGLCQTHYSRLQKRGGYLDDDLSDRYRRVEKWLIEHSSYSKDDCLTWPFCTNDLGRGAATINGVTTSAPRVMCILAHGEPPTKGHQAAHTCGNGHLGCVNPRHLRWATAKENEADKLIHGTLRRGRDINTNKLSEADVLAIRASDDPGIVLAAKFGVTNANISSIRKRKIWAWLED